MISLNQSFTIVTYMWAVKKRFWVNNLLILKNTELEYKPFTKVTVLVGNIKVYYVKRTLTARCDFQSI